MEEPRKVTTLLIGVSSGFGKAVAYFCLRAGHHVIISARTEDKLKSMQKELEGEGRIDYVAADASSTEGCEELFSSAEGIAGRINNVAVLVGGFVTDNPENPSGLQPMMQKNLIVPSNVISVSAKYLHGGSSIVLVSSTQTLKTSGPFPFSYTISKTAVNKLVEVSASFFMRKGIRINVVAASTIMDSFEVRRNWKELRKMGDTVTPPEDIAQVIVWLLSEESQWVTGTIIPVDGGERFSKS